MVFVIQLLMMWLMLRTKLSVPSYWGLDGTHWMQKSVFFTRSTGKFTQTIFLCTNNGSGVPSCVVSQSVQLDPLSVSDFFYECDSSRVSYTSVNSLLIFLAFIFLFLIGFVFGHKLFFRPA